MNDPILTAYLQEYASREGSPSPGIKTRQIDESDLFEMFANYTVLARLYGTDAPLPDFSMGQARGIDGLAILVNNRFVDNQQALADVSASFVEAEFVFTQVKRSSSLDEGDIFKYCAAVKDFIMDRADTSADNEDIARMRSVRDALYNQSAKFTQTPIAKLYYVYTGKLQENPNIAKIFEDLRQSLVREVCFLSDLTYSFIDLDRLREWYRIVTRGTTKDIVFKDKVELPAVEGVKLAVLGYLPATDYIKLITDEDGNLEQGIFYENVRAFLGDTRTNLEIASTLRNRDGSSQYWFPLLHNGITIVARDVSQLGQKLTLRDFQVVNGCQSSHVLHGLRKELGPGLAVPVKVIVTESTDITDSIIRGTNRQNVINDEAFVAMEGFQKGLESFYVAFGKQVDLEPGLLYERRAHQYDNPSRPGIAGLYPITIPYQIKGFIGMFSGEPHSAHRYYGQLLELYGPKAQNRSLFLPEHQDKYAPYYLSAYFCLRLERLFTAKILRRESRAFKFLVLDALRLDIFGSSLRELMSLKPKAVSDRCSRALAFWTDTAAATQSVSQILYQLEELFREFSFNSRQNAAQSADFTASAQKIFSRGMGKVSLSSEKILASEIQHPPSQAVSQSSPYTGEVIRHGATAKYGFIKDSSGAEIIFDVSSLNSAVFPKIGAKVGFDIRMTSRGPRAESVLVLSDP